MTLISLEGGPRHTELLSTRVALTSIDLRDDEPGSEGLYRRTSPLRTVPTDQGPAEVWVFVTPSPAGS